MKKQFNLKKSLALVLALGFSASCLFAVQATASGKFVPQPKANKVELKIKKVLNLPSADVKTPDVEFKFKFEAHSFNNKEEDKTKCPAVDETSVKYAAKDTEATDDKDANKAGVQLVQTTEDVLKELGKKFTEAGQYTYKVTEEEKTLTGLVCSKAEYLVSIFVKTKADNKFTVDNIQIKKTKDDNGQAVNEQKTQYDGSKDESNKFEFNNNYDPKAGNDNPTGTDITTEDKKGFVLQKKVAGEKVNADEPFTFNFTVSKPAGSNAADTTFDYKIVNAQGTAGNKQTGTYGTAFDVVLKNGERVVFANVLLGSMVKAKETKDAGYTHSLEASKMNNVAVNEAKDIEETGKTIGDKGDNSITFVNTQQTATGILLNSLPFIVLALVALAGIVFFVKNRKHDDLEA